MSEGPLRPVDHAMAKKRPAKEHLRQLWVDEVRGASDASTDKSVPLYLTLPGAQVLDIRALIKGGLLTTTETGAVAKDEVWKVVAVEESEPAVAVLLGEIPGLRVLTSAIQNVLRGPGIMA